MTDLPITGYALDEPIDAQGHLQCFGFSLAQFAFLTISWGTF